MSRPPASPRSRYTLVEGDRHEDSFADEVRSGLTRRPKSLPCRFLYDEAGSELFERICELPEYYLTRTERQILAGCAGELAAHFDSPTTLVELGSGSSSKTRLLIEAFLKQHGRLRYVPVDISYSILRESSLELLERYRSLEIHAIAGEYREGLRHVSRETSQPKLIAWLGSTIGNLDRQEAVDFLGSVRDAMLARDRMLLGIDLRKDAATLEAAYDDAAGVTARFSLNLLERMNRELDADFDPAAFRHRAVYREEEGRVEIQIVSRRDQKVRLGALDLEVDFAAGEGIHTEDAHKYSPEQIDALAEASGLRTERRWLDPAARFSLNLFSPR